MTTIKEHLLSADINLSPGKLALVKRELSAITRSPNLIRQAGKKHENVWQHTGIMLDDNLQVFNTYPIIGRELDYASTVGGVGFHDFSEAFTPHGDLNYANASHNSDDLRRAKDLAEFEATHHFVHRNIIGKKSKLRLHQFVDEWAIMDSPLALYVRILDMVNGNKAVIEKAMDLSNGEMYKMNNDGVVQVWPMAQAGSHISNIASNKTFPILEKLIHRLQKKEASMAILQWFNEGMMKTYHDTGWAYLPVIAEMQNLIDSELKGYKV